MRIRQPLGYQLLGQEQSTFAYTHEHKECSKRIAAAELETAGYHFIITDIYEEISPDTTAFTRHISGTCQNRDSIERSGIRFLLEAEIAPVVNTTWRVCIPSVLYTGEIEPERGKAVTFMEDRMSANFAAVYESGSKRFYSISKLTPSLLTEAPVRKKGDSDYLHKTSNCSLGYRVSEEGGLYFRCCFPYEEIDSSPFLDHTGTPVRAFYPLDGSEIDVVFSYLLREERCESYTEGIYQTFVRLAKTLARAQGQEPASLPFSLEDSIHYRNESLKKTYREFGEKGAGFFFHFDPQRGYGSRPSGYGTSFHTIPHNSYVHILEYGFTGRQINAAWNTAALNGGSWIGKGERVIDFFIDHAIAENGWLYSLYDLHTQAPFYSFGDAEAPRLHYISRTEDKGNYLRTMTEPMTDILEAYQWYREQGIVKEKWLEAVLKYADFLTAHQHSGGSWYRAYKKDGSRADIGADQGSSESATAIPVIFLCNLYQELCDTDQQAEHYRMSAEKAGEYILNHMTACEYYEGGTLDNPNIVDKEASQYAMASLFHLYKLTGRRDFLDGARAAAQIFVTWNYIWNAPQQPGTYLAEKNFNTRGFGAINSIWGGGVVDIYSLFHIRELYELGVETGETFFIEMAEQITDGTRQILSHPGDDMGFKDTGMQPEGFGICCQGADEGMIRKGDIWGTLGWIYSAGIYGLGRYLKARTKKGGTE